MILLAGSIVNEKTSTKSLSSGVVKLREKIFKATACYIEANQSRHLSILSKAYAMDQEDGGWLMDSVQYRTSPGQTVNFIIHDLGSDIAAGMDKMNTADVRLLVGGTKPFEYPYAVQLRKRFEASHAHILCPFVAEESEPILPKLYRPITTRYCLWNTSRSLQTVLRKPRFIKT